MACRSLGKGFVPVYIYTYAICFSDVFLRMLMAVLNISLPSTDAVIELLLGSAFLTHRSVHHDVVLPIISKIVKPLHSILCLFQTH